MQFYHPGKKCGNFCLVCKNKYSDGLYKPSQSFLCQCVLFVFSDDPKLPVVKQALEQACHKASQVTRSPQQDVRRYEVHVHVIINISISYKYKPLHFAYGNQNGQISCAVVASIISLYSDFEHVASFFDHTAYCIQHVFRGTWSKFDKKLYRQPTYCSCIAKYSNT